MENCVAIAPPSLALAISEQRALIPLDDEPLNRLFAYLEQMRPTMWEVRSETANFFGVSQGELCSGARRYPIVQARQVYCYLAYRHTRHAMRLIGYQVGLSDHSAVRNAIQRTARRMIGDERFADEIDLLKLRISELVLLRTRGGLC